MDFQLLFYFGSCIIEKVYSQREASTAWNMKNFAEVLWYDHLNWLSSSTFWDLDMYINFNSLYETYFKEEIKWLLNE